mgnify:CR=1 FL=1
MKQKDLTVLLGITALLVGVDITAGYFAVSGVTISALAFGILALPTVTAFVVTQRQLKPAAVEAQMHRDAIALLGELRALDRGHTGATQQQYEALVIQSANVLRCATGGNLGAPVQMWRSRWSCYSFLCSNLGG